MAFIDKLTAIANAIRAKTGESEPMSIDQMPGKIASIVSEGAVVKTYSTTSSTARSATVSIENAQAYSNYLFVLTDSVELAGNTTLAIINMAGTVYTLSAASSLTLQLYLGGTISVSEGSVTFTSAYSARYFYPNKEYTVIAF